MSKRIVAGPGKIVRRDYHMIDPRYVEVQENLRGRWKAPTDEQVAHRAISMIQLGQLQPVQCRRKPDNTLLLTLGFTRTAAVRLIRKGFTYAGKHYHDPDFLLSVIVVDGNDKESFVSNVVENHQRDNCTPVDDAFNQRTLRDKHGYSDKEVMELYDYSNQTKYQMLKKVLQLPEKVQEALHDGDIALKPAVELLDAPPEEWDRILSAATKENGKINGAVVIDGVRELLADETAPVTVEDESVEEVPVSPEPEPKPGKKYKARTIRNIRTFFESCKEDEEVPEEIKKFSTQILKWVKGQITDKTFYKHLNNLYTAVAE